MTENLPSFLLGRLLFFRKVGVNHGVNGCPGITEIARSRRGPLRGSARALLVVVGALMSSCAREAAPLPPRPDLSAFPAGLAAAVTEVETAATARPAQPDARLRLGQLYQANGLAEEARVCYLPLAEHEVHGARASYYLGVLAFADDDLEQGREWLSECVRRAPNYLPAQVRLADATYKAGLVDEAAALYAEILRRDGGNVYAQLATARERLRQGDTVAAKEILTRLTREHPEFGAGSALYAQVLDRAGERAEAARLRARALAHKDPPPPDPWMDEVMQQSFDVQRLAMLFEDYAKAARIDESMVWLRRLEAVAPDHWLVCQIRALAHSRQGRFEDALAEYQRALAAGGDARRLYPALVATLTEMKRYAEAEESARAGLAAAPGSAAMLVAVARLRQARGDTGEAERRLAEALEIEPRNSHANRTLALIWWEQGQKQKALPLLRIVMETDPNDVAMRGMVGEYLLEQGDAQGALAPLEEALSLAPDNEGIADLLALASLRVGNVAARAGKLDEAIAAYDRAAAVRPTQPDALANKARVCLQSGQLGLAEDALRRLLALQPGSASVLVVLGDVQEASGNHDEARATWNKILTLPSAAANPALQAAVKDRLARTGAR